MDSNVLLRFENLGKEFSYSWGVCGISGELRLNSKVALVGRNGSGKSTLLCLLAGIYRANQGRLWVSDNIRFCLLGHESMLYSRLSAIENLLYFQRLNPHITRKDVHIALSLVGLSEFSDQTVDSFSHGMKKRLSISLFIAHKPDILFMDEPFSGLDVYGKELLKNILSKNGVPELNWRLKAFMLAEHDLGMCQSLCNEFWRMSSGRYDIMDKKRITEKEL